ncbi:MAG: (2Fe-2S) ferredoxin domain-containing protein [Bacillota bacterium]
MKSLEDLRKIRDKAQRETKLRGGQAGTRITIAMGTCGIAAGARECLQAILEELAARNQSEVLVVQTGCLGLCDQEPLVSVEVEGQPKVTYGRLDAAKCRKIVTEHIVNGHPIGEWAISTR